MSYQVKKFIISQYIELISWTINRISPRDFVLITIYEVNFKNTRFAILYYSIHNKLKFKDSSKEIYKMYA